MKTFNKNKIALALAITFVSGTFNTAFANDNAVENQNVSIKENNGKSNLIEIGTHVPSAPLKGFSKPSPLITVLQQIIPNGWIVKKNDNKNKKFETNRLVSWEGGQDWVNTLKTIATTNNINVIVNWTKKEVVLFEPLVVSQEVIKEVAVAKPKSDSVFELEATPITWVGRSPPQSSTKLIPEPVNPTTIKVNKTPVAKAAWSFDSKLSLKENVINLGKVAGYKVDWRAEDYPIDENRVLFGDFDGEDGPIKQLSVDYGPQSRVEQPLSFVFFQNKYLIVENFKFEQSGTPQYIQKQ